MPILQFVVRVCLKSATFFCGVCFVGLCRGANPEDVDFNRDIRPILSENCFVCHGPDQNKREGGLRLDIREHATVASDSNSIAIVAGHPEKSEIVTRIFSNDPDLKMPPARIQKVLTELQKEQLKRWIADGAPYQGHWAFITPKRPSIVPIVGEVNESANPIDYFVRARLQREGLHAALVADKETRIRRVSLDLTGLPPTPSDVKEFLNDTSKNAYEKAVDRLLSSPHYGERMALTWMDYARYADSNGYQSDGSREIFAWRDWIIQAYNQNMPFDQFTIEQLAGDMLPNATRDQIIATGFNRNHRLNGEGGRIEAEWFVETVIDRVETTGLTWLGLTFNCCRCHDHKFDPISQREFYSLFAYFNSNEESGVLAPAGKNGENTPPLLSLATPEQESELVRLTSIQAKAVANSSKAEKQLEGWMIDWEKSLTDGSPDAKEALDILLVESATSEGGARLIQQEDRSWLASGTNPPNDTYVIRGRLPQTELTALVIEFMPDATLPNKSLGRASNGNFVLTEVEAKIEAPNLTVSLDIEFTNAQADYEQSGWPAKSLLPSDEKRAGNERIGWAIDGNDKDKRLTRKLVLQPKIPVIIPDNAMMIVTMKHASGFKDHNVGRFRISTTDAPFDQVSLEGNDLPKDILSIVRTDLKTRSKEQKKKLVDYFKKNVDSPYRESAKAVEEAKKNQLNYQETIQTTMVMKEGKPRDAFVLNRGEYDKPGDPISRGLPAVFSNRKNADPKDRLELARWIVSTDNPLTARVWVNREWERFFGTGLVKTTENFGAQA